jgi:hypothetical protein
MSVNVAYDLWSELKRFMSSVDREEAADILVNVLIDNDYDAEEIRTAFKGDNDVKRALQSYLDDTEEDESEYDEEDEDNYV